MFLKKVGDYYLSDLLGSGTYGHVYKATQENKN